MALYRRLLIDCTHTLLAGYHTGVQRVVRRVSDESCRSKHSLFQVCVPLIQNGSGFSPVHFDENATDSRKTLCVKEHWSTDVLANAPGWYRSSMKSLCSVVQSKKLKRWLLPEPGHMGIFKVPAKLARRYSRHTKARVVPGKGDLLLLPDAYWAYPDIWRAVDQAKKNGADTAAVIYDLIPLTHSHLYEREGVEAFRNYLSNVLERADLLLTISHTVGRQVADLLPDLLGQSEVSQPIVPFRLGAEFSVGNGECRTEVSKIFQSPQPESRPFLMIGTVEVRKNHMFALQAMERLWEQGHNCRLVIVGGVGWRGEQFMEYAKRHRELGKRLFMFHDLSDAEVDYCYRNCQAVVFPSVTEGFGLPIVEALHRGSTVYASDIEIHREVGGSQCDYFPLDDIGVLVDQLSNSLCRTEPFGSAEPYGSASRSKLERNACIGWGEAVARMHSSIEREIRQRAKTPELQRAMVDAA